MLGEPTKVNYYGALSRASPPSSVHSYSLMLMASRLGIKITNEDSDLSWIPYLALSLQTPPKFQKKMSAANTDQRILVHKLCSLKPGSHPADRYFKKLIEHYLHTRSIILGALTEENKKKYIWSHSWMKFSQPNGGFFYFNMYSKEKADLLPSDAKALFQKFVLVQKKYSGDEKLKDYALQGLNAEINQVIMKKNSNEMSKDIFTVIPPQTDEIIKFKPHSRSIGVHLKY